MEVPVRRTGWLLAAAVLASAACSVEQNPLWQGGMETDGGTTATGGTSTSSSTGGASTSSSTSSGTGSTGSTDSASTGDTGGPGTTGGADDCLAVWHQSGFTFEAPTELTEINHPDFDGDPSLTVDGLTLYFSSNRAGGQGGTDVWRASRPDRDSPFQQPEPFADVSTADGDLSWSQTADGLTGVLVRDTGSSADIWIGTRAATTEPFSVFALVDELNTAANEWDATISEDGQRVYFTVSPNGNEADVVEAVRPSPNGPFDPPQALSVSSPTDWDDSPTLGGDALVVVFASDRTGGPGDYDIWYATRGSTTEDFGTPQLAPVINSPDRDSETHLSKDGCELFFMSTRPGGTGGWDLYYTRVLAP